MSAKPRSAFCTLVIALLTGLFGCSGSSSPVATPDPAPEPGLFTSNFIVIDRVTRRYDFFVPSNLGFTNRIAAVAPVVAAMPAISCNVPVNPISVLFMNGTTDPLLPYGGGEVAPNIGGRGTVLSAEDSIRFWVAFNQTDATPTVVAFTDIDFGDNSTVSRYTYSNGAEGTQVVLYEVAGGGHLEPSMQEQYSPVLELILGHQNHDMEMAQEIWDFFEDKTLH